MVEYEVVSRVVAYGWQGALAGKGPSLFYLSSILILAFVS